MLIFIVSSLCMKDLDYNKIDPYNRSVPPFWLKYFSNDLKYRDENSKQAILDSNVRIISSKKQFLMGTDLYGRDVFGRSLSTSQTYFLPVFFSVTVCISLGILLGISQNFISISILNRISIFITDFIESFPRFMILLILFNIFNLHLYTIMMCIGLFNAPRMAKLTANKIESLKKNDQIDAAKELGLSDIYIVFKHILYKGSLSFLLIQIPLLFAETVLIETSLSFLGIGVQGEVISWGFLVAEGRNDFIIGNYWVAYFPAFLIIVLIWSAQSISNGFVKWFGYQRY